MSFIVCPDIHGKREWFNFLSTKGLKHDATLIPGDVLDFNDKSMTEEAKILEFLGFAIEAEKGGRAVIFTSGNHDLDDLPFLDVDPKSVEHLYYPYLLRGRPWMEVFARFDHATAYSNTRVIGDAVILSLKWIPWGDIHPSVEDAMRVDVARASGVSRMCKLPMIIVYHEAPESRCILEEIVTNYEPAYFLCGHEHSKPLKTQRPARRLNKTTVINVGQNLDAATPCHGILDVKNQTLLWNYTDEGTSHSKTFTLDPRSDSETNEITLSYSYH